MRILVTRPLEENRRLLQLLQKEHFQCDAAPLLDIQSTPAGHLPPNIQAVVVTSINAARRLKDWNVSMNAPTFAVGRQSAKVLEEAGYTNIQHTEGGAEVLLEKLLQDLSPDQGMVVHAAGDVVRVDIAERLKEKGFSAQRVVLYHAIPTPSLPHDVQERLKSEEYSYITFFSPRTAEVFWQAVNSAKIPVSCVADTTAVCMSNAVAQAVHAQVWKEVRVGADPTLESLVACLRS